MKQSTREWVEKAEEDFLAALALARRRKAPLHNAVCFHCQQSAEKYLKARLEEAGLRAAKTHDLETLLNAVLPLEPLWASLRSAAQNLTDFAVDFAIQARVRSSKTPERRCAIAKPCAGRRARLWVCRAEKKARP